MNERYRSYKKLHRKVDLLTSFLIQMEKIHMATWQDVKDAIAYGNEADAKLLAKLDEVKAKLDNLPVPEDMSGEFEAAVAEIRGHADEMAALIADKPVVEAPVEAPVEPAPVEVPQPVEEPAEAPVEAPIEPTAAEDVPTDIAQ